MNCILCFIQFLNFHEKIECFLQSLDSYMYKLVTVLCCRFHLLKEFHLKFIYLLSLDYTSGTLVDSLVSCMLIMQ